jgi:hypothetical protein
MRCFSLMLLILTAMCLSAAYAETPPAQNLWGEITDGFDATINIRGFGVIQEVVDSTLNRDNVLEIPRYRAEINFRPDFYLDFRRLSLSVKPRWEGRWREWDDGVLDGDSETDDELFVNEWLAQLRLHDQLFVSYGRENLQWGPSYLLSPSNPFFQNNGRNNPQMELPGLDYARVVWIPSSTWTASFIVNTDEGTQELIQEFEETYALKVDYVGEETFFSLIPSHQEGEDVVLGLFAGWNVSDPLLLYGEGSVSTEDDDARVLVGGSYTLKTGATISLEFYHNQGGCTLEPFERCFGIETSADQIESAADALQQAYENVDLSGLTTLPEWYMAIEEAVRDAFEGRPVEETAGFNIEDLDYVAYLVRENYSLLQFTDTRIKDRLNIILRWIHNFDDSSDHTIGIVEYEVGDHATIFTIGNLFLGGEDTEFGSLLSYSLMAGISYTF